MKVAYWSLSLAVFLIGCGTTPTPTPTPIPTSTPIPTPSAVELVGEEVKQLASQIDDLYQNVCYGPYRQAAQFWHEQSLSVLHSVDYKLSYEEQTYDQLQNMLYNLRDQLLAITERLETLCLSGDG